ncbi:MAG: transglycosylase domain-containing protein [Nocardioidaceae bacterium]
MTYRMIDLPDPNEDFQAETTTVYYSDGKHELGQFALQNRDSIGLEQVPEHMQDAVISAEDRSFRSNQGLDPKGIVRAAWNNLTSESQQGASTITQQYVKILYLSQERTWSRKIKEAFLAVKVQNALSKDEILEGYLNTIYYGRGAYGVQAAAQAYFDKDAKDLTVPESAVLASVINSPGQFDPAFSKDNRERLLERYDYVLSGMVDMGSIDESEAEKYEGALPKFPKIEARDQYGGQRGYLMTLVRQQLESLPDETLDEEEIDGAGLKVVSTFDWAKERAANAAVKAERPDGLKKLRVALTSIEPGTGAVRAMIGGRDFLKSQVNWATSRLQPGSAFKPFALAAGLKNGYTLQDTFDGNSPLYLPGSSVPIENQGGESYGYVDLAYATQRSINTAYVDMTNSMEQGPEKVIAAAKAAGIPEDTAGLDPFPSVALGSGSVSPLSMANAYATFAAQGEHAEWYVVEKVTDASGVRYEHRLETDKAFPPAITSNVSYALQQVVAPEGTGYNALELGRPAAGKTGTATIDKDRNGDGDDDVATSWFVGYTPQLSTAVMFARGNGQGTLNGYLDPFFGGTYPALTWTTYMKDALQGEPIEEFPEPAYLDGESPTYVPPPTIEAPPSSITPSSLEPTEQSSESPEPSETPTSEPPTSEPPTSEPPTSEPPTSDPPTSDPSTSDPSTSDRRRGHRRASHRRVSHRRVSHRRASHRRVSHHPPAFRRPVSHHLPAFRRPVSRRPVSHHRPALLRVSRHRRTRAPVRHSRASHGRL